MRSGGRVRVLRLTGALGLALLAACGGVRETFGLSRNAPDEFRVVTRAPLTVPPGIGQSPLSSPSPGAPRPQEPAIRRQAEQTLLGAAAGTGGPVTASEQALLAAAGADQADPAIRTTVEQETRGLREGSRGLLQGILGYDPVPVDPVVDARREFERLSEARQAGDPLAEGEVPQIEPERPGLFR